MFKRLHVTVPTVLAVAALAIVSACSSGGSDSSAAASGDSLVTAWPSDVSTLDPG
ncbi:MAG: hypothetical protein JWN20_2161, partial [Jatrophihabitantaceae bacterium]|nr:hypothetical protein [Jatrophihabitantaceae bacterium]